MKNTSNQDITVKPDVSKEQEDVLLLIKILKGKFDGNYTKYRGRKGGIATFVIYAEFDRKYHWEHSKIDEKGQYVCRDGKTGEEIILAQDKYLEHLKSVIANDKSKVYHTEEYNGKKNPVNKLKNKIDNTFKSFYHIIDGIDFEKETYKECPKSSGKKKGKVSDTSVPNRSKVIELIKEGNGKKRRCFYKYKEDVTSYVYKHYKSKNENKFTGQISNLPKDAQNEIYNKLSTDHSKWNTESIRNLEKEIAAEKADDVSSYLSNVEKKYLHALRLAMILSNPDEVAVEYIKYKDFKAKFAKVPVFEQSGLFMDTWDTTSDSDLFDRCLELILTLTKTSKNFEKLKSSAEEYNKEWDTRMRKGFKDQIELLREVNSGILADVLFVYAQFCMSIHEFKTAEKNLEECASIYHNSIDLVIIHSNLSKLYGDWKRIDEAIKSGKTAIKYMKSCEFFANRGGLNIYYAQWYNHISVSYFLQCKYDEADKYINSASESLKNEDNGNLKVSYLKLMIGYNKCAFRLYKEDYTSAYDGLKSQYDNCISLCKMNDSPEHLELKSNFENAMARCNMNLGNFKVAKDYIEKGLKTYDELCHKVLSKYEIGKLYLLKTLADIYETENINDKAKKQYLIAIEETKKLIDSDVHLAKKRLLLTNHLAEFYDKIGNYSSAIKSWKEMLSICDELERRRRSSSSKGCNNGSNTVEIGEWKREIQNEINRFQSDQLHPVSVPRNIKDRG